MTGSVGGLSKTPVHQSNPAWSCATQPGASSRTGDAPTSKVRFASILASSSVPIWRSHCLRNSSKMASPCCITSWPSAVTSSRLQRASSGSSVLATYPRACNTAMVFAAACFETDKRRPKSEAFPAPATRGGRVRQPDLRGRFAPPHQASRCRRSASHRSGHQRGNRFPPCQRVPGRCGQFDRHRNGSAGLWGRSVGRCHPWRHLAHRGHGTPGVSELLPAGRERRFLAGLVFPAMCATPQAITDADLDEFART